MNHYAKKSYTLEQISKAKRGNRRAQNILLNNYWDSVFYYIFNKIKNENDSEDISIQTFTKAFSKLKLYNPDFNFKTWLISIAQNTMLDFLKKNKVLTNSEVFNALDIYVTVPSPEEELINKQKVIEVKNYLKQLKPRYRQVIYLRYIKEKTYKEIACELSININNVKILILRGKKLLYELIKDRKQIE